jgi:hypothetical protein
MNLSDHIKIEIERKQLTREFSCQDLLTLNPLPNNKHRIGEAEYEAAAVRSILSNHSTGPGDRVGDSVRKGGQKLFEKLEERGRYRLV